MNASRHILCFAVWLVMVCTAIHAAEVLPPSPARYFNDYAGVVPVATADQLNAKLKDFEQSNSCQVLVAVFQKMQSDSSIEDYTHRIATAWKVGQKGKNNGLCLFVFMQERRMRIEVGYGLEGAIPDATGKRIIEDEIKPFFKSGDYAAGLVAGVDAILKAARGEYTAGAGATAEPLQSKPSSSSLAPFVAFFVILLIFLAVSKALRSRGTVFGSGGRSTFGGGFSSGGSSGGGGFSGGGGSFGGGGASGGW